MDHYNVTYVRHAHQRRFPIGNHLMTLTFLANSNSSEQRRERLTSHLALRGIMMRDDILDLSVTSFRTLYTPTKTWIAAPSISSGGLERPSRQRKFYFFEAGKFDSEEVYWAADEEDEDMEGVISKENDTFWILNKESDEWHSADKVGRKIKKSKGTNKGKKQ